MLRVYFNKNRTFCASNWDSKWGKTWRRNWSLHRENGPSGEWDDGGKSWSINGLSYYSEEDFNSALIRRGLKQHA